MLRNIVFTINNYTDVDERKASDEGFFSYVVYGREIGVEGTPHLQGYGELRKRTRFNTICRHFEGRAHIEARQGTQEAAINYCKKDGNFVEIGAKHNQGLRGDLDAVRQQALDEGMRQITRDRNAQQIRVAEKFLTYNEEPRNAEVIVKWFYGGTGTGKSRTARAESEGMDVYVKNTANKWWDGYDGHEIVILDDFRETWWPLEEMLSILDRYEKRIEVKGGMRQLKATTIYVTTPEHPERMYQAQGADRQLLRRITEIRNFDPEADPEVGGVILMPPDWPIIEV